MRGAVGPAFCTAILLHMLQAGELQHILPERSRRAGYRLVQGSSSAHTLAHCGQEGEQRGAHRPKTAD